MATNISSLIINAPVQKVWDALTKPELVKQWQFGSTLITSWQPGDEIRFRAEWKSQVFEQWGKVLEVVPFQRIRYSLFAPRPGLEDKPENYFEMSYLLSEDDGHVRLDIIQGDNRPGAIQEEPQGEENAMLKTLKSLVES